MRENRVILHIALGLTCLGILLSSCGQPASPTGSPVTPSPSLPATLTPIPTVTPTATAEPPAAILLAGPGADQAWVNTLQTSLDPLVNQAGLRWQLRQQLSPHDLGTSIRLVVALPPDPGLAQLVASAPNTQFLALDIPGLPPAPNLTSIGAQNEHPDQQGFIAGVIAAMLSADWRVGTISLSDGIAGRAARSGFLNGVIYFCGLCRPAHPPFYEYPLYIELPSTATTTEWQEAANYMVDHYVTTVYIYPGAGDEAMLAILAQAGINLIGSGNPPESARSTWVVSLSTDVFSLLQNEVQGLLDGSLSGGKSISAPIQFTQINPTLLTPGKQRLVEQALSDLQGGYIDTGVDLSTGELRP